VASIPPLRWPQSHHDLPSPGVGEDFDLRHHLNKSWKKYGVGFSSEMEAFVKKGRDEAALKVQTGLRWRGLQVGACYPDSFAPRGSLRILLSPTVLLVTKNFCDTFPKLFGF
jgi:hypothetical protein